LTNGQILALSAAGVIIYSLLRKSEGLKRLFFYPSAVRALKWDGLTPVLTVGLKVQNTSNQSYQLNSLAGEVYCNKILVGNVGSFVTQVIPPNSERVLEINIRMMLIGILNDIIKAIIEKNFSQTLEMDAYANIDNLQVPIELTYKVGK